jgi:hypothetical protein
MSTKFITTLGESIEKGRKVEFLWDPYIPKGRITVLDGDPGLGKSFVTLDICARITAGIPFPNSGEADEGRPPAPVLICNCEDEVATTLLPRLRGAKADLKLVHFGDSVQDGRGDMRFLTLPNDEQFLAEAVLRIRPAIIVIDPIMAFLDETIRTQSDQSVRRALRGLKTIAENTGAAVLLVRHLNKGGGTKAIYRGGGSIGFVGLARSALLIARNPEAKDETLFLHTKSNIAKKGETLTFRLQFARGLGTVRWTGVSSLDGNQALREYEPPTEAEKAVLFLKQILANGAEVYVGEVIAQAKALGIAPRSVTRAKGRLTIFTRKKSRNGRPASFWCLERKTPQLDEFLEGLPKG